MVCEMNWRVSNDTDICASFFYINYEMIMSATLKFDIALSQLFQFLVHLKVEGSYEVNLLSYSWSINT